MIKLNKTLLLLVLFSISFAAHAQNACHDLFKHAPTIEVTEKQDWSARRQTVVEFLKRHREVPSFIKETANGPVPVMLLNEKTFPILKPLIDQSVGYGYNTAIEWSNNGMHGFGGEHALMRVQETLIDNGHPGTRRGPPFTEVSQTGISWRELGKIMPWRPSMIQNSYLMPKGDLEAVRLYHLVRRVGLIRVKYAFTNEHELDRSLPNLIDEVQENCFRFAKTDQGPEMIAAIDRRLKESLGADFDSVAKLPEAARFISRAKKLLLETDPYDGGKMSFFMTKSILRQSGLNAKLPTRLTDLQRLAVANLLVSKQAISDYTKVLEHYKISSAHGHDDVDRGVVSFTLIYNKTPIEDQFTAATYASRGNFFHWTNEHQHPIP